MPGYDLGLAHGSIVITYDGAGVAKAEASLAAVKKSGQSAAVSMDKSAAAMGKAGAVIAVGLALAVKQSMDFQQKLNVLVTAAGESPKALGMVGDGIKKIAVNTGTSLDDLVDGMYILEKSGRRGASGLAALSAAAEGAREEGVPLSIMTTALTSMMQSYGASLKDPVIATNMLKTAAGLSKTTMKEFAGSLAAVLPVASAAGVSFPQVAGAIATLTQHGTSANEATQELANTIRNLQAPSKVAISSMQQLGINVVDLESGLGKRGLSGTLAIVEEAIGKHMGASGLVFVDALKKSKSAGQDMQTMLTKMPPDLKKLATGFANGSLDMTTYRKGFRGLGATGEAMGQQFLTLSNKANGFNDLLKSGSPQAQTFAGALKSVMGGSVGLNTALQLGGASTAYFNDAVGRVGAEAKKTNKEVDGWTRTSKTTAVVMGQLKSSVEVLAVGIGDAAMPAVLSIVNGLKSFTTWLSNLSPKMQGIIGKTLVFGTVFLLGGAAVLKIAKVLKTLGGTVVSVAKGIEKLLIKMGVMSAANQTLAATEGEQAVAADAAAASQTGLDVAMDANPIGIIIIALVALVAAVVLVLTHLKMAKQIFLDVWGAIKTAAGAVVGAVTTAWNAVVSAFTTALSTVERVVTAGWAAITGAFKAAVGAIVAAVDVVWSAVVGAFHTGIAAVMSVLTGIWAGIKTYIVQPVVDAWNAVTGAFTAAYTWVTGIIQDVLTWITDHWKLLLLIFLGPLGAIIDIVTTHFTAIKDFIVFVGTAILTFLTMIWNAVSSAIMSVVTPLVAAIVGAFTAFIGAIMTIFNAIKDFVLFVWDAIKAAVMMEVNGLVNGAKNIFNGFMAAVAAVWNAIKAAAAATWNAIKSAILVVVNAIKAVVVPVFNALSSAISVVWNGIKSAASVVWNGIKSVVTTVANAIRTVIETAFNAIKSVATTVWNAIKSVIQTVYDATIKPVLDKIKSAIDIVKSALTILKGIWDSIWGGISSTISRIWNGVLGSVLGAIKAVVGDIGKAVGAVSSAIGAVKGAAGAVGRFLGLDTGGWVPGPEGELAGNVRVHGGEYVVNPDMLSGRQSMDPSVVAAINRNQMAAMGRFTTNSNSTAAPAGMGFGPSSIPASGPVSVRVFIGNKEINDNIRVVVGDTLAPLSQMVAAGGI